MDLRYRLGLQSRPTTIQYVSFEKALRGADFVSVHVPLVHEHESSMRTFHLFDEQSLHMMKPSAFLINT